MSALPLVAVVLLAAALAFANGSNDVSKGVATLVGSGVSNFRGAVLWGTVWTVAGGSAAAFASQGLVSTFSGRGFLNRPVGGEAFLASVAAGAVAWVLFASRTGLPVSTTHAIAGALAGAGMAADGPSVLHWSAFTQNIALPLALSPIASIVLVAAISPRLSRGLSRVASYCVCVERRALVVSSAPVGILTSETIAAATIVARNADCADSPAVAFRLPVVYALHWLSSALTSFARGLNDTPKIVALGIVAGAALGVSGLPFYLAVAAAMGLGSAAAGFRVTETLARKVTSMSAEEGFGANVVTSVLVGAASLLALPVSTTHVSSGAIIGIGLARGARSVRWTTVKEMLLAWLVTVPIAGLAGAGAFRLISLLSR